MAAKFITITQEGKLLGSEKVENDWGRKYTVKKPEGEAKIISKDLALYCADKGNTYLPSTYHIIHIPTGYVIAATEYDLVKGQKEAFETSEWEIKDNVFTMINGRFSWQFTCRIKYEVKEQK